jgi:hypothetical protein
LGSSNVITNQQGQPLQLNEYTPFGGFSRDERLTPDAQRTTHFFTGKKLSGFLQL